LSVPCRAHFAILHEDMSMFTSCFVRLYRIHRRT
jgi:hypothetical protein